METVSLSDSRLISEGIIRHRERTPWIGSKWVEAIFSMRLSGRILIGSNARSSMSGMSLTMVGVEACSPFSPAPPPVHAHILFIPDIADGDSTRWPSGHSRIANNSAA